MQDLRNGMQGGSAEGGAMEQRKSPAEEIVVHREGIVVADKAVQSPQ